MESDGATKVKKKFQQKPLVAPKNKIGVGKIVTKSNQSNKVIDRASLTVAINQSAEGRVSPCNVKSPFIADMLEKFEKFNISAPSKDHIITNSSGSRCNLSVASTSNSSGDCSSSKTVSSVGCYGDLDAESYVIYSNMESTDINLNHSYGKPNTSRCTTNLPFTQHTVDEACTDNTGGLSSRHQQTSDINKNMSGSKRSSGLDPMDCNNRSEKNQLDTIVNIGLSGSVDSSVEYDTTTNNDGAGDDESWEDEDDDDSNGAKVMMTKVKSICERSAMRKKASRRKSHKSSASRKPLTLNRMDTVYYENNCMEDEMVRSPAADLRTDTSSNFNNQQSDQKSADSNAKNCDLSYISRERLVDTQTVHSALVQPLDTSHIVGGPLPPKPSPRTTVKKTPSVIKAKVLSTTVPAPPPRGASVFHSRTDTQVAPPVSNTPPPVIGRPPPLLPKKLSTCVSAATLIKSESVRRPLPPVPGPSTITHQGDQLPGTSTITHRGDQPPAVPPALPPRVVHKVKSALKSHTVTARSTSRSQLDQLVVTPDVSKSERTAAPLSISASLSVADLKSSVVQRRGSSLSLQVPISHVKGDSAGLSPSRSEGYLTMSQPNYLSMANATLRKSQWTRQHAGAGDNCQYIASDRCRSEERTLAPDDIPNLAISSRPLRDWSNLDRLESVIPANAEDPDSATSDYSSVYQSRSSLYDDEPLYQIYHQGAIVRDVVMHDAGEELECHYENPSEYMEHIQSCVSDILKRGSMSRTLSSASSDPHSSDKALSSLESASRDCAGFKKLWCEMPKVRESGVLNHMTMDERRLQESIFEIISSEASYLKSMNLLVGHFMSTFSDDLEKNRDSIISSQDLRWLFSNCRAVREASVKTLECLESLWMGGCVLNAVDVCERLSEVARQHYTVYIHYCKNAVYQERKFHELMEKNAEFAYTVQKLESVNDCRSLPLSSFLTLPMQRITRLPLLLQAMRSRMAPDSSSSHQVLNCMATLQKIVKQCNDGAKKMINLEQMCQINEELDFRLTKKIALISESRYFVKKGQLTHICKESTGLFKRSKKLLFFFLFNDLLIITKKKSDKQYEVIEHSPRLNVHAEIIRDENISQVLPNGVPLGCKHLFFMVLMDRGAEYILSCSSLSERTRWVQGFTPPEPLEGEEKIYESWDCPQVQAVRQYVAQQPDELSLEESDVINVLHKVNDGWYEGERIRDGEKGWFPVNYTVEIQNAHVRARNMRQQYRLMTKTFDHSIQQTTV